MDLSEINWDFNAAGSWPLKVKAGVIFIVCCLVAGGGFYYFTLDQLAKLDQLEQEENTLIDQFKTKQQRAANLPEYEKQLTTIKSSLADMMKQMPAMAEVENLLQSISQTASSSGLESKLFQPEPQVEQDFYIELPTSIEMEGKYEELGLFVSGVASMPRIVTIHNINLSLVTADKPENSHLLMKATIKTYTDKSAAAAQKEKEAADAKKPGTPVVPATGVNK